MKIFTRLASVVFALVAAAHLMRVVLKWTVVVGPLMIPLWVSVAGAIVTGLLSVMLWRESKR